MSRLKKSGHFFYRCMKIAIKTAKKIFGKSNIKNIEHINPSYIKRFKIVVFVPPEKADDVAFKMASAGAGVIGNYTVCSFRTMGTGTFMGGEASDPAVGEKGKFEKVDEIRLEMLCNKKNLDAAIDKMLEIHPYEEPAFDIYEVIVKEKMNTEKVFKIGLKKKIAVKNVLKKINDALITANLTEKIKNKKVKQAVLDFSGGDTFQVKNYKNATLYIKRNNNITNVEII